METTRERLEARIMYEPNSGCHLWIGTRNQYDYGLLRIDGQAQQVHRISYELNKGEIPLGMQVLHNCDTPCCVNPHHLFLGTPGDNMRDKVKKNRQWRPKGVLHHRTHLTENQVKIIRETKELKLPRKEVARYFGIHYTTVSSIIRREIWNHI